MTRTSLYYLASGNGWRVLRTAVAGLTPFAVAAALVLAHASPAEAYFIDDVAVLPDSPIRPTDAVMLEIGIVTPYTPASLYRPTVVYASGTAISVVVFATSGQLTATDSLVEVADLGAFEAGSYRYTVTLVPDEDPPVGREFRVAIGEFTVVPEPTRFVLQGLVLLTVALCFDQPSRGTPSNKPLKLTAAGVRRAGSFAQHET